MCDSHIYVQGDGRGAGVSAMFKVIEGSAGAPAMFKVMGWVSAMFKVIAGR